MKKHDIETMVEALVSGWHGDTSLGKALRRFQTLRGIFDAPIPFADARELLRVYNVDPHMPTRAFIALHYPAWNDVLWAGINRDKEIEVGKRTLGLRPKRKVGMSIGFRQRDKRTNWATTK